ncbi:MAG: cupin domain-containing protein [Anaerolineae bacterium]
MQRVSEFELPFREGDSGVKYLIRGPRTDWGVILLKPGERLSPHYHNEVDECFYILRGEAVMIVNGRQLKAIAGDVYRMEPSDRHEIRNDSDDDVKMVFIKAPFLPEDRVDA